MTARTPAPSEAAGGGKWAVMAAVGVGIILATIDSSIVNVALPTLVEELGADFALVQWVVLAYLLTLTTLTVSVGRLADIVGAKPIYTSGFVVFTAASVLCGLAPDVLWLIGFRVLQAIGAAMILGLGAAIVTRAFPVRERGVALGVSGAMVSIGIVVGPALGGILVDAFSWRAIFFVNLPVGALGTLMAARFVPALPPRQGQRFDYAGAVTLFLSLSALLLALTLGQGEGRGAIAFAGPIAVWLLALAAFLWVEHRAEDPMVDLRLFRSDLFSVGLGTGFVTFVAIAGATFLAPFFLEGVLGYAPRQVGLLLAVVPVALGITAPLSGWLSDRYGTRPMTVIGLAVAAAGYLALAGLTPATTAAGFAVRFLPIGIGMGLFQSPNNSAIMGAAPAERLGVVSGLLTITRTLGQSVGIAVVGALWAHRVAFHAGGALPEGVAGATPAAAAAGWSDTFHAVAALVGIALLAAAWSLVRSRSAR